VGKRIVGDVPALPGVPGSVTVIVVDCMSTRVTVAVPDTMNQCSARLE